MHTQYAPRAREHDELVTTHPPSPGRVCVRRVAELEEEAQGMRARLTSMTPILAHARLDGQVCVVVVCVCVCWGWGVGCGGGG